MRFCPFCSAENADELAVCQGCGRRLPPLPPRRNRTAPPTGVQLPQRQPSPSPPPPRRSGNTLPPPIPPSTPIVVATPIPIVAPARDSAPALPPPPETGAHALLDAITPGPAAERREPPPPDVRDASDPSRRRSDSKSPPVPPTAFARPGTSQPPPIARSGSPSQPPPIAPPGSSSQPPPLTYRRPSSAFDTDAQPMAPPIEIAASPRGPLDPPPTRIQRSDDRPFAPPKVLAVPEIPEPGLVNAARYAYRFAVARWQRRGAIKQLGIEIKQDTEALDQVPGALGRAARNANVEGRVFSVENAGISAAEERIAVLHREYGEVDGRKAEENSKFGDVERERNEKLTEAERQIEEASRELQNLEGQRRSLRDKRKELERRQRAYLKSAEDHDRQSGATTMGDQRQELRRAAEQHRKEAAALEPDRQEIDRRLAALERPIGESTAKLDAAKAELDAAKRSLNDAREGHTHRLAGLDSGAKPKAREIALAEGEIARRLVTLGTLVNLNRIEDPSFAELYQRIDRLRGAITARTTEIERLAA